MKTKICSNCEKDRPISEFYFDQRRGTWTSRCRKCRNLSSEKWRNKHKEKIQIRRYKITNKDYIKLFNKQKCFSFLFN